MLAEWIARELDGGEGAAVDWTVARCRDGASTMVGLFFSEQLDDIARAKAVCATCALREPCLASAIERREPWGVWGGQLFLNGKILAFKRKRGRPPKNPPSQLVGTPSTDAPDERTHRRAGRRASGSLTA